MTNINTPALLVGTTRVDLRTGDDQYATHPRSRGARWFPPQLGGDPAPLGELHLGTGTPGPFGSGPLVDLSCGDPDWWDQVSRAAADVARVIREMTGDKDERGRAEHAAR